MSIFAGGQSSSSNPFSNGGFAPLVPPRLATTTLAYMRELSLLQSRHDELSKPKETRAQREAKKRAQQQRNDGREEESEGAAAKGARGRKGGRG